MVKWFQLLGSEKKSWKYKQKIYENCQIHNTNITVAQHYLSYFKAILLTTPTLPADSQVKVASESLKVHEGKEIWTVKQD